MIGCWAKNGPRVLTDDVLREASLENCLQIAAFNRCSPRSTPKALFTFVLEAKRGTQIKLATRVKCRSPESFSEGDSVCWDIYLHSNRKSVPQHDAYAVRLCSVRRVCSGVEDCVSRFG